MKTFTRNSFFYRFCLRGMHSSDYNDACCRVGIQVPVHTWPSHIRESYFSKQFISFQQRMSAVCFFYGNGCSPTDIKTILLPKLRDKSAVQHIDSMITSILSANYDTTWYYYNVHMDDYVYLNGTFCSKRKTDSRIYNLWDSHCQVYYRRYGRYPTLDEEEQFFSSGCPTILLN